MIVGAGGLAFLIHEKYGTETPVHPAVAVAPVGTPAPPSPATDAVIEERNGTRDGAAKAQSTTSPLTPPATVQGIHEFIGHPIALTTDGRSRYSILVWKAPSTPDPGLANALATALVEKGRAAVAGAIRDSAVSAGVAQMLLDGNFPTEYKHLQEVCDYLVLGALVYRTERRGAGELVTAVGQMRIRIIDVRVPSRSRMFVIDEVAAGFAEAEAVRQLADEVIRKAADAVGSS